RPFEATPIPVRLLAELGEVEVIWPTGILAELAGNGREFLIPATFRNAIVDRGSRAPAGDQPKLAFEVRHVLTGPTGQESAIRARLATEPQRAALCAFDEAGDLAFEARLVGRGNRAVIDIERPLNMILGQSMTEDRAGVIEDDCVALALGRSQHAPDHL